MRSGTFLYWRHFRKISFLVRGMRLLLPLLTMYPMFLESFHLVVPLLTLHMACTSRNKLARAVKGKAAAVVYGNRDYPRHTERCGE